MPASICLLIATFLWGSSFIALKYAIDLYHPAVVIFLRMLTTLMICMMLWRYVKRFNYEKGDWKYLFGMSLAEPCLYFLFEGYALEYTSASQAGVIVSCFPLIVAILAFLMIKEHLSIARYQRSAKSNFRQFFRVFGHGMCRISCHLCKAFSTSLFTTELNRFARI